MGSTETFKFRLRGVGLSSLDAYSFVNNPQLFAVRFRGFDDGKSDKVPGVLDVTDPTLPKLLLQTDLPHNDVRSNSLALVGNILVDV